MKKRYYKVVDVRLEVLYCFTILIVVWNVDTCSDLIICLEEVMLLILTVRRHKSITRS